MHVYVLYMRCDFLAQGEFSIIIVIDKINQNIVLKQLIKPGTYNIAQHML